MPIDMILWFIVSNVIFLLFFSFKALSNCCSENKYPLLQLFLRRNVKFVQQQIATAMTKTVTPAKASVSFAVNV